MALAPGSLFAHGFAQRYDLPVPLGLYMGGAAAAVVLSFLVIAFFVRGERVIESYPRLNLLANPLGRFIAGTFIVQLLRIFSVSFLALVIVAGYIGHENPFENIAPTAIWVIWWVGFAYISGLVGDLWAVVNPWRRQTNIITVAIDRLFFIVPATLLRYRCFLLCKLYHSTSRM